MDFELRAAKEKLEREQRERKEKARIKIERERKAREEARRQQEALEAERQARRIQATQAALAKSQQEEQDLIAGNGIRFNTTLHAILYQGYGDKIKLPPSSFDKLSTRGALDKGPMFFELSTVHQKETAVFPEPKTTHSGVLEFTATEDVAEIPPQVWQNLFHDNNHSPLIRVRYVRLLKGKYAKLQPEVLGFSDIPNHRAVLETTLRQHATLSEGDILIVHHGGIDYRLRVLELKPSSSISVLETDIEVDIIEPSVVAGTTSQGMLIPLVLGKSEMGIVEEGKYNYYKFSIDSKIANANANKEMDILVKLVLDNGDTLGDADLYISRHPLLFPTQHQYQWSSHDVGTKIVSLTRGELSIAADTYSIGVFGYKGTSKYKIIIECQSSVQPEAMGQKLGTASAVAANSGAPSQLGSDSEQCQNCKQFIPTRTVVLHEAYCRRHNVVCQHKGCGAVLRKDEVGKHIHCLKCGRVFQQEEMEKHMKVFHEPLHCRCGEVLEKEEMVIHQSSVCPLRMISCRFCGDMVQAGSAADDARDRMHGYSQHESLCGCRTAPCDTCGRAVMLKEMDLHRVAVHEKQASENEDFTASKSFTVPHSDGVAHHSAPLSSPQTSQSAQHETVESSECPICYQKFSGSDSDGQLNAHLDKDHFSNNMDIDSVSTKNSSTLEEPSLRRMLVSCPICGINVHSERDLSQHIDMVH